MSDLREQMRRSREAWLAVRGHEFLIRRPTIEQCQLWSGMPSSEFIGKCVVGWRGVRVCDLVPDGTIAEAPFEVDALVEWAGDDTELAGAISSEILRRIKEHAGRREAAEKN